MQHIEALSLTPAVDDWLDSTRQPRILHVFERACNLINERREVLSIVTPEIGNGPFNLVIEDDVLFSACLKVDSSVSIRDHQLRIDNLTFNLENAKPWNPYPNWERLHTKKDRILPQLLSLRVPLGAKQSSHESGIASSLASADISTAKSIASQLAGLGQGLTPAGDDFILGGLLAVWIIHSHDVAKDLAREIADTAAPLTTLLSAAWLRSAGRGEAGILWHRLFDTLISEDATTIQFQIAKLLSVGHTSGADALAGFINTFISYAESETKICLS